MDDPAAHRLFRRLDRAFWLIWLGFPALVWILVRQVADAAADLAALVPEQAACLQDLPLVTNFSAQGRAAFWALFGFEMCFYVLILALAHVVIHRCATGQAFVAGMVTMLRRIGFLIALYPVVELGLGNLVAAILASTGDVAVFQANFALDLPVVAVGFLLVTMAAAIQMAVRLHQDAELTI